MTVTTNTKVAFAVPVETPLRCKITKNNANAVS